MDSINKKRRSYKKTFLFLTLPILAMLAIFSAGYFWYDYSINSKASSSDELVEITVLEGSSLTSIAPSLKEKGVLKSDLALRIYLRLNNLTPNIKVGTFSIPKNLTVPELIKTLEQGVFKESVWVTIKEGSQFKEIGSVVNSEIKTAKDPTLVKYDNNEFIKICENPDNYSFTPEIQNFLDLYKPAGKPLQGYLYPDTYRIDVDFTSIQVIEMMIQNLIDKLEENNINPANINSNQSNLDNFFEVLTLASILEKEAGKNDDRSLIAGVFHNRLRDNWLLQSDATVNFITGKSDPGVTFADAAIDSPYNTYKYTGLPPSPINSPRIESIIAVINPQVTDYFYFRHDSKGNIYFSKTFEEHNSKNF